DAVVHNDLREMGVAGAGRTFRIYRAGDSAASAHLAGVGSLCGWVDHWLSGA
ncbi:MAG: hypothetical protein RL376_919, partial [Verrucomicrobiota bacterium]